LKVKPENELSRLYSARAWSQISMGDPEKKADEDIAQSMNLAQKCKSTAEEATAEGIQSIFYLKAHKLDEAKSCYGRVCTLLKRGVPQNPVLDQVLKTYKQDSVK
jgi:hypothetical protein